MSLYRLFATVILISSFAWPVGAWASEATLRAAFIYNFIKFIEWPALPPNDAIRLCILDDGGDMRQASGALSGRLVGKHPIDVVYISPSKITNDSLHHCEMLYIGKSFHLLPSLIPTGLVVVANEAPETHTAVSISLHRNHAGRIEFTINNTALRRSEATVSSQLLKLATNQPLTNSQPLTDRPQQGGN